MKSRMNLALIVRERCDVGSKRKIDIQEKADSWR